jgi:outer membrane protein OmpA-like peptidoglycan-associated protein
VLGAVLTILLGHPEIKVLRVEGHTDNQGSAVVNRTLSEQRAASVVRWLVQHGIDASRLSSQGFGFDRPIDTNDTPEGRKNNRRVEFHIEPL